MRVLKGGEENWVAWKINNDPVITHRVSWISLIRTEQAYWLRSRVANPTYSNGLSLIDGKNLRSAIYREPRYFNSGKKKKNWKISRMWLMFLWFSFWISLEFKAWTDTNFILKKVTDQIFEIDVFRIFRAIILNGNKKKKRNNMSCIIDHCAEELILIARFIIVKLLENY